MTIPDNRAVCTGLLKLQAEELRITGTFSRVWSQQFRLTLNTDDSILGQITLPPAKGVPATKRPIQFGVSNTGRYNIISNGSDSVTSLGVLLKARPRQSKYARGKNTTSDVGYTMWLATWPLETITPWTNLDQNITGSYTVRKIMNQNAYKLHLQKRMRNHHIFHVSHHHHYTPLVIGQQFSALYQVWGDDLQDWEVAQIIDYR